MPISFFTREDELCGQFSHSGQELFLGEHIRAVLTQTPERHLDRNTGRFGKSPIVTQNTEIIVAVGTKTEWLREIRLCDVTGFEFLMSASEKNE